MSELIYFKRKIILSPISSNTRTGGRREREREIERERESEKERKERERCYFEP